MAGTFGYTESTNIVVVTGGTSGTPADVTSFVTADRAGVDTSLLSGGSPASNLVLTYAVRPVEDLAVLVKCIVANKTAEADFIFITGTDWRGAAQTESIDVTAGNGSYTSTKYWATITTLDCSDNAVGGGTVWADGDLSVTQDVWGVVWDYGNAQYRIDCYVDFGNGSTSTYFKSTEEMIVFPNNYYFQIKANASFQMGEKSTDGFGEKGSFWNLVSTGGGVHPDWDGPFYFYGSQLRSTGAARYMFDVNHASGEFIDSIIDKAHSVDTLLPLAENTRMTVTNTTSYGMIVSSSWGSPITVTNLILVDCAKPLRISGSTHTIINPLVYNQGTAHRFEATLSLDSYLINVTQSDFFNAMVWGTTDGHVYQQYYADIEVADKDGVLLDNVTVLCEDTNDSQVFSELTGATNTGKIDQQTISYRRHYNDGTNKIQTYSPHKFTLSKAGYETLVLENITTDGPIDWYLELQQQKQSPAPWQEGVM